MHIDLALKICDVETTLWCAQRRMDDRSVDGAEAGEPPPALAVVVIPLRGAA
jgi:hypothetical protein